VQIRFLSKIHLVGHSLKKKKKVHYLTLAKHDELLNSANKLWFDINCMSLSSAIAKPILRASRSAWSTYLGIWCLNSGLGNLDTNPILGLGALTSWVQPVVRVSGHRFRPVDLGPRATWACLLSVFFLFMDLHVSMISSIFHRVTSFYVHPAVLHKPLSGTWVNFGS